MKLQFVEPAGEGSRPVTVYVSNPDYTHVWLWSGDKPEDEPRVVVLLSLGQLRRIIQRIETELPNAD